MHQYYPTMMWTMASAFWSAPCLSDPHLKPGNSINIKTLWKTPSSRSHPNIHHPSPLTSPSMASSTPRTRSTTLNRDTNETKIQLSLNLDGGSLEEDSTNNTSQQQQPNGSSSADPKSHATQASASQHIDIDSGIGFLDHMLHALAKHAGWSLRLRCRGDLHSKFTPTNAIHSAHPTGKREQS